MCICVDTYLYTHMCICVETGFKGVSIPLKKYLGTPTYSTEERYGSEWKRGGMEWRRVRGEKGSTGRSGRACPTEETSPHYPFQRETVSNVVPELTYMTRTIAMKRTPVIQRVSLPCFQTSNVLQTKISVKYAKGEKRKNSFSSW